MATRAAGSRPDLQAHDYAILGAKRLAFQVARLISQRDSHEVAQAWFQGLNPQLGDRSPARLLREGDLAEVGPEIVAAARAFVVGG